jgi:hypothetical protein
MPVMPPQVVRASTPTRRRSLLLQPSLLQVPRESTSALARCSTPSAPVPLLAPPARGPSSTGRPPRLVVTQTTTVTTTTHYLV